MRRLRRLAALPPAERRLLAEAALVVPAVRLGLWLLPFRMLRRLPERYARLCTRRPSTPVVPERIAWAVAVVSTMIPFATCLTQALAVQALLARRGHPALLRIGVAKDAQSRLMAHAWVEAAGRVVIGGGRQSEYPSTLEPLASE